MTNPRFIIRSSYGNDSVALIQWAHEQQLEGVTVLYSDTGWARRWWQTERVPEMEEWVRSLGFQAERTSSIGMEALVKAHKGWPMRLGKAVSLWAYGWRYPFPGRRVGDFGRVVLDDLKDGRDSYATHWADLQPPPAAG